MISDDNYQAQSHRDFCTQEQLSLFSDWMERCPFAQIYMFMMMERGPEITHLASVKIRIGQEYSRDRKFYF